MYVEYQTITYVAINLKLTIFKVTNAYDDIDGFLRVDVIKLR